MHLFYRYTCPRSNYGILDGSIPPTVDRVLAWWFFHTQALLPIGQSCGSALTYEVEITDHARPRVPDETESESKISPDFASLVHMAMFAPIVYAWYIGSQPFAEGTACCLGYVYEGGWHMWDMYRHLTASAGNVL
jgi:hypothetical protein